MPFYIQANSSVHLSQSGEYLIATGGGTLVRVIFTSGEEHNLNIYDGLDAKGRVIGNFDEKNKFFGSVPVDAIFRDGLFIEQHGDFDCIIVFFSTVIPPQL